MDITFISVKNAMPLRFKKSIVALLCITIPWLVLYQKEAEAKNTIMVIMSTKEIKMGGVFSQIPCCFFHI